MDRSGTGGEGGDFPQSDSIQSKSVVGAGKPGVFSGARGSIVTARGTGEGLVIRLDSRVSKTQLLDALTQFLDSRRSFLEGNSVSVEWIGGEPDAGIAAAVSRELKDCFDVTVVASDTFESGGGEAGSTSKRKIAGRDRKSRDAAESSGTARKESAKVMRLSERVETDHVDVERDQPALGLFGGIEGLDMAGGMTDNEGMSGVTDERVGSTFDAGAWDDPDARIVYKTLRSGQKIETEHSLIVIGDVNSGAELVAGGDIVVLGSLRGVAHAGAYDETGGGRFIVAMDLQPTQLRIGSIISRGTAEGRSAKDARSAREGGNGHVEIARVDGNMIMVEPFNPRVVRSVRR